MTAFTETRINVREHRQPDYDIDSAAFERWSPRSFLNKEVPDEVLFSLFEAARWAPSAANFQPWRFIIARSQEDRQKFYPFINQKNRAWCEKAPVLAVILSSIEKPNGEFNRTHAFDAGTAWGYLSLEAHRKGLIVHGMGGYDPEEARKILNVSENYDLHAVVAIGYQGESSDLPEAFQEREKPSNRRPLTASVFEGGFEEPIQ